MWTTTSLAMMKELLNEECMLSKAWNVGIGMLTVPKDRGREHQGIAQSLTHLKRLPRRCLIWHEAAVLLALQATRMHQEFLWCSHWLPL